MPAVQPARLKIQVAHLLELFRLPEQFNDALHDLLSLYANRTQRSGETGQIRPIIPSYDPPIPVIRLIQTEIRSLILSEPQSALELCDSLWKENWWEFRTLAAYILGQIPLDLYTKIIVRLNNWLEENLEENLIKEVGHLATKRIQAENQNQFFIWVQTILARPSIRSKKTALYLITKFSEQPNFENLPAIFSVISPFIRISPPEIRPDVLALLMVLIERSPNEIAFIFRQSLESSENPDTNWFIRKTITKFPLDLRDGLLPAARKI